MNHGEWARKYVSRWSTLHPNGVVTHGSGEPILSVLDVRGFPIKNLFVIGFNPNCGVIIVPTQQQILQVRDALEPTYAVTNVKRTSEGDWSADYDRRELDGSVSSHLVTDAVLKDGTQVIRDGRWIR